MENGRLLCPQLNHENPWWPCSCGGHCLSARLLKQASSGLHSLRRPHHCLFPLIRVFIVRIFLPPFKVSLIEPPPSTLYPETIGHDTLPMLDKPFCSLSTMR